MSNRAAILDLTRAMFLSGISYKPEEIVNLARSVIDLALEDAHPEFFGVGNPAIAAGDEVKKNKERK